MHGVGMSRSARACSVQCFEQLQGLDTTLYKNFPLPLGVSEDCESV